MKKLARILVIINSMVFLLSLTAYSQSAWKYSYYFGGSSNGSKVSTLSLPANLVTESTPSNYPNIPLLHSSSVSQSEMSIAASPINSSIILAGDNAIDLSLGSPYDNQASQGNYYSSNQGESWTGNNNLLNNEDPTSDPAVSIDRNGYMYFTFLDFANATNSVVVKKSTDGGSSWENGVTVAANPELDKPAMTIDAVSSSPYKGYVYVAWTDFEQNPSPIMFSFSTDGGDSFSTPINISGTTGYNYAQGVSLCVGPSGKLYATWAYYASGTGPETSFGFNVSSDGGKDWLTTPRSIVPSGFSGIKGLLEKNGNYIRVSSWPSMSVDMSHGPYRGTIYIVWANGTSTTPNYPLPDIEMIASNNEGSSFNVFPDPIQVNTDNSATDKWEPSVNVDPYGGVNVVFYSSQVDPTNNVLTQAYMARSTDGGATFSNYQISSVAFTPAPVNSPEGQEEHYMGDYLGICAAGSYVIPCWSEIDNSGILQAYAARFQAYLLVPQEYSNISSALSSASSGQTIVVAAGTTTIASSQTVPAGVNLDILPGATLAFQSGCSLTVNGSLIAFGTPSQPIYFEEATSGSHWGDVQLNGDNNQFSNCVFDGGTTDLSVNGGSGGTFTSCIFKNATSDGMYLGSTNSTNTIRNCIFESNQTGIEVWSGAAASINQSTISDNTGVGLYMESGSISYFTNNAVENNGSYGIDVEGGYLNAGNGIGYYSIGTDPNSTTLTAGAGKNRIDNNGVSSGSAQIFVDTNGRLYVGDLTNNGAGEYSLADGFNRITSSNTLYIYNLAMTQGYESQEQWTVPAVKTYWGGSVTSENFYGTVDYSYQMTSDPSGGAGADTPLQGVNTPIANKTPATLMTAAMAVKIYKSAPTSGAGSS